MYKLNSGLPVIVYVIYTLSIVLSDYILYITGIPYPLSVLLAALFIGSMSGVYIKKKKISFIRVHFTCLDGFILLLMFIPITIRSIMPEASFDTSNYHLYFQEFLGRDFVNEDFFPIRAVNASALALGDRMYYLFRYFLGYRAGTLLNTLVIFIIYFQIKGLIKEISKHFKLDFGRFGEIFSFGSLICLLTENIFNNLATYMVDYLAVPFLLEIFRIVIFEEREDIGHTPVYLCLLAGLATGIKMTNIVIVFPMALFYILLNVKKLHLKSILVSFFAFVFCIFIYMYINWDITGNILFPYANEIFQSPYFSVEQSPNDFSAFNVNFGPKTILEYIFWPMYMIRYPERSADIAFCSGRLLLIVVILFATVIVERKKIDVVVKRMFIFLSIFYLLFLIFFRGYMRYIPVLELVGSALALVSLINIYAMKKKFGKVFTYICILCLYFQTGEALDRYINENYEWGWRNISDKGRIMANLPYIFHDYEAGLPEELLNDIDCMLVTDASGSLAVNIKDNVPLINLTTGTTNEYTENMLKTRLNELNGLNIYTLCKKEDFLNDLDILEAYGFAIENIIPVKPNFYDQWFCMPLLKLSQRDGITLQQFHSTELASQIELEGDGQNFDIFVGDFIDELKYNEDAYFLSVYLYNSVTGENSPVFEDEVISPTKEYVMREVKMRGGGMIVFRFSNLV